MKHSIDGWAYGDRSKEQVYRERYEQLRAFRGDVVDEQGPSYGARNFRCKPTPGWSPTDYAIACDEGNVCFGGNVDDRGSVVLVTIWTD